ncbi:hypothetical protein B0H14DRAFT_3160621 [Mycena olivaceomarginata]|nr:hypothetical protein B0H14DRAFT_3160621 [Mycena olivaceomarginata]
MVPELAFDWFRIDNRARTWAFRLTSNADPLLSRAQSSCLDAHTSFATNTVAANVYKGNGPTKILMPGGVLNILDLTSIITSKGAMVLCARVALMTSPITCYEVAGNVPKSRLTHVYFGLKWSFS